MPRVEGHSVSGAAGRWTGASRRSTGASCVTLLPSGTAWVSQTLPPMVEPAADGDAAEDGGASVDDHVVLHDGVAVDALDGLAVGVEREALGAEGHALVEASRRCR